MALHESLRDLILAQGPGVTDDAEQFRGALDDFLSEDEITTGDMNLLVDAVRLGALRRFVDVLDHGAEPDAAIREAGAALARDRGTDDVSRSRWAVAILGYALGAVDDSLVSAYRAGPGASGVPTPPHRTTSPEVGPRVVSEPPVVSEDEPQVVSEERPRLRTWLVVLAVVVVIAGTAAAAWVLQSDEEPSAETSAGATSRDTDGDASGSPADATASPRSGGRPSTSPSPSPSPLPSSNPVDPTIPADFPLDLALSERSVGARALGPGPDAPGPAVPAVCGTAWPAVGPADRLGYALLVSEGAERRTLRTYRTADDAVLELTSLREALAGCTEQASPGGGTIRWQVFPAYPGYDSETFGYTYAEGLGGALFTVVRVGSAVLAVEYGGEYSADSLGSAVDSQHALVRPLVAEMCVFTEDGC